MAKHKSLIAIGGIIRKFRVAKGFTQESFADHAGLDRAYFGAIERGERNVAVLNLMKIATSLEVQVGELFPLLEPRHKKSKT